MQLPAGRWFHKRRKGIGKGSVMETKALKKQLGAAIAMVLVAAIALGAATFAWFVNNNAVKATGVDVSTSSAVPNLYITNAGKTTDVMAPAGTNKSKLLPVSTSNGADFYDTKHWVGADTTSQNAPQHQYANEYKTAEATADAGVYDEYTFTLGVKNGSMNVYFDSTAGTTNLTPNANMGTAGRFAIKFGDGAWKLFKIGGTATGKGYYTDKVAENATTGDYAVGAKGSDSNKVIEAAPITYSEIGSFAGAINDKGQASANQGANALATISGETTVTVRVWYEGCDPDCVSENAGGQGIQHAITGNLGFVGVAV